MTQFPVRPIALAAILFALTLGASSPGNAQEALSVASVAMGNALDRGQPVEAKTSFAQAEGRLYVVVQLQNPSSVETQVRVMIRQADGRRRGSVNLDIPARRRYRTVARFSTRQAPGNYEAVVLNAAGETISTTAFTITP
ncbi:MAG: hypothetical protein ACI9KE_004442 [Polyangiales bacterium]|jgi:hypothetical protein